MTIVRLVAACAAVTLAVLGCQDPLEPEFCICTTPVCTEELGKAYSNRPCTRRAVETGEPLWVLHRLAPGVTLSESLDLTLTTPCARRAFSLLHYEGVAVLSTTAPPGSGCSLEITGKIANSTLRIPAHGADPSSCAEAILKTQCAAEPGDAGTDAASSDSTPLLDVETNALRQLQRR